MQSLNRKEIAIKTLLILISILSVVLIKNGIHGINSSINNIENMGGFSIYPINSSSDYIQSCYYDIVVNILITLCPAIILISSIISIFIQNRIVEIAIVAQNLLVLLFQLSANNYIIRDITDTIGFYIYIVIVIIIVSTIIIISVIKEKTVFIFYIIEIVLLIAKYVDIYKFWYDRVRGDVSLFRWFDMYGVKYAIVTILGFCILILKLQKNKAINN